MENKYSDLWKYEKKPIESSVDQMKPLQVQFNKRLEFPKEKMTAHFSVMDMTEGNKYFIPDIEDIRVGYECEIYSNDERMVFEHTILNDEYEVAKHLQNDRVRIRVSYLTKEQIEAEGWEPLSPEFAAPIENLYHFRKGNYFATYNSYRHTLSMILRDPSIEEQTGWEVGFHPEFFRFFAECKDINTFRWICKLLKIK